MQGKHFYSLDIQEAKHYINKNFPQFHIEDIELSGEGFDNIAYLVNKKYIFRFSKRKYAAKQLKIEINLLKNLKNTLSINIPNFKFVGRHIRSMPFVGYEKIEGDLLEKKSFLHLNKEKKQRIMKQLSKALADLHSFPISKAKKYGVQETDFKKKYTKEFEDTKKQIYPIVNETTRKYLEDLFTQYLSNKDNFTYNPSLIHADLGPDHILCNLKKGKIKGVIDFGDVQIGDPDFDLKPLYKSYGEDFLNEFLKLYSHDNKEQLVTKLEFFSKYDSLQKIFVGLRESDSELQKGLKKLKKNVKLWKASKN